MIKLFVVLEKNLLNVSTISSSLDKVTPYQWQW